MKAGIAMICLAFIQLCCNNNSNVPADILPAPQMQVVLWDMMRADRFLTDYVLNRDTSLNRKSASIKLYQQVFAIHGITKEIFQKSFSYYQAHPALLQGIMDSLNNKSREAPTELVRPQDTIQRQLLQPIIPDTSSSGKKRRLLHPD